MSKEILIGTEGNQPFAIPDQRVSRKHAKVTLDDNNQLFLTDLGSTNHTFIHNGREFVQIEAGKPVLVSFDTMVRFGYDTMFHISKLFREEKKQYTAKPSEPRKKKEQKQGEGVSVLRKRSEQQVSNVCNVSHLKSLYEKYQAEKLRLEKKQQLVTSLTSLTVACTTIGGLLTALLDVNKVIGGVITVSIVVSLWIYRSRLSSQVTDEKVKNENRFKKNYKCPQCGLPLAGKMYETLLVTGCPVCKKKYTEK